MNETKNNTNKPAQPSRAGRWLVMFGIVVCTMGGAKFVIGAVRQMAAEGTERYTDKMMVGGTMLVIGLAFLTAGLICNKTAKKST